MGGGDGVQVSSDRTMTLARGAVPPPGEALPDWDIIARVARAMGFGQDFAFTSAAEIFAEASRFSNPKTGYDITGISHARLRKGPVQWPAPPGTGRTGTRSATFPRWKGPRLRHARWQGGLLPARGCGRMNGRMRNIPSC
ncbi:hypothetical protein RAA17_21990 [Komagataeibacter rhaeticus]|nr:hypothetical protein [Komagataeibacter rhaeticus]